MSSFRFDNSEWESVFDGVSHEDEDSEGEGERPRYRFPMTRGGIPARRASSQLARPTQRGRSRPPRPSHQRPGSTPSPWAWTPRPPSDPDSWQPEPPAAPPPSADGSGCTCSQPAPADDAAPDAPGAAPADNGDHELGELPLGAPIGPLNMTVTWRRITITGPELAAVPAEPGVYLVVARNDPQLPDRPAYLGRSRDLRARWRARLEEARRKGALDASGRLVRPVAVWFGVVPRQRGAARALQHALARAFRHMGLRPRHAASRSRFVLGGRVVIAGLLPRPYLVAPYTAALARLRHLRNNTVTLQPPASPRS